MSWLTKYLIRYGIALFYILGAFVFGEHYPFSHFPMYNSIPNWSYAFYFVDENNKLITCESLNTGGGKLGHMYSSIAEHNNLSVGAGIENKQQLRFIGEKVTQQTLNHAIHIPKVRRLKLIRVFYYYNNDSITTKLQCIYEKNM